MRSLKYFVLATVLLLTACAGTRTAYREAENLHETAYVIAEHYSVVLQQAAELAPSLSADRLIKLREVRDRANPIVLRLISVSEAWQAVRSAENQEALEAAIAQASAAVAELVTALKDG